MHPNPREDLATRPQNVDPALLLASRPRSGDARRRRWDQIWPTARFIGLGFFLGAIAVFAIASVRMAKRIESLTLRVVQLERERGDTAQRSDCGLVFPALDIPADPPPISASLVKD